MRPLLFSLALTAFLTLGAGAARADLVPGRGLPQAVAPAMVPAEVGGAGGLGIVLAQNEPGGEHGVQPAASHAGRAEGDAEHKEHAGFSVKTFALQLVNFGALLFLLIYFGGRAMNKALRARHEQLKNDIGEAARLRDEAKAKFEAQARRVAELEKEVAALRESMRKDAEREQARALDGVQERARKIQEEMRFQIDQQVKQAESLLRAEVASAAVALAGELARKTIGMDDQRRLAQEFVAGFDGGAR
jgi:F0F1-type ATP synthase membrane subunit b/b'